MTSRCFVDGIAFWSPHLPGWDVARAAFRGDGSPDELPAKRPAPQLLAPAERRRAPDTVALALEVATQAVAASGRDAKDLPSIFVSSHGDLAINDYMCATLASAPTALSPTKFHNSVHNAAAGYWTIATGSMAASTATSAREFSFAEGLLDAVTQCAADDVPVLLVGFDVTAVGPLRSATVSDGLLAVALVIAPVRSERSVAAVDWSVAPGAVEATPARSEAAIALHGNAMSRCLPGFEALAQGSGEVTLPLADRLALNLRIST
jgi:hypothetical protein